MTIASLLIASSVAFQAAATVALGLVERDLTGDGKPEILRVVGVGPTIDDLEVTFTIESAGKTIYQFRLERLTRAVGFDAGRHVISAEQHRARLKEFDGWFFAQGKFQRPAEFVTSLAKMARGRVAEIPDVIARDRPASDTRDGSVIWQEILNSPVTIFMFSPGATRWWHRMECSGRSLLSTSGVLLTVGRHHPEVRPGPHGCPLG